MINFRLAFSTLLCMAAGFFASAQEETQGLSWAEKGEIYGKIFANYHTDLQNLEGKKGFEAKRAYLGYKVNVDNNFSANIKLDIGSPDDVSEYSLKKRFAYVKNAYVQYKYNQLKLQFGIADCQQFKVQEKFWGYRYIFKSFQDIHKFGPSADIGIFASYKLNDWLLADASFTNGEGYSKVQTDEDFKAAIGFTIEPTDFLQLRVYYDTHTANRYTQNTLAGFAGFTIDRFKIGGEYSLQLNNNFNKENNKYGYSAYTTYQPVDKFKVFGRFDYITSNILENEEIPWNLAKNGSAVVAGMEYSPISHLKLSLNYQDWVASAENGNDERFLYFNLQFSF